MVKPGALLLLLAVAASQVDLTLAQTDIQTCPITLYGSPYTVVDVDFSQASSFAVCFGATAQTDCLVFDDGGVSRTATIGIVIAETSPVILGNLIDPSECYVKITLSDNQGTQMMIIEVFHFGQQAAMKVTASSDFTPSDVVVDAMIGGSSLTSWTLTNSELMAGTYRDISGCRDRDVTFQAGSPPIINPDDCYSVECSSAAVLSTEPTCTGSEVCQGNGMCIVPTVVCTVTGDTVINFFNLALTIPDRCAYDLYSVGQYYLTAVFRERRSKAVVFLDELMIYDTESSSTMYLQQGGTVLLDGSILPLDTTPQAFLGVEFTKDQTGVTARFPGTDIIISFDGNTAHVSAPIDKTSNNLCGNPSDASVTTTPSNQKSSTYSATDCEIVHDDILDPTIDCPTATTSCELMNDAPFTACHNFINQMPYVAACKDMSCKYPDVDGLICQYLEAYAMSCYLREDITLEDWRSAAGCDAVLQHSCRDQYCIYSHEFCGEKLGQTRCLCRALFAAPYEETNSLGDPTVCTQNSATLTLAACLLWDRGIDYTSLHLFDPDCVGDLDPDTNMVTFSFESSTCGTEVTLGDNNKVVFQNAIITRDTSSDSLITRQHEVEIDFSCHHVQPDINTMTFHIADSSVTQFVESGDWSYTVAMHVYSDPAHQDLMEPELDVMLNQKLWLDLTTEGLDGNMVAVVIDSCWATDQSPPEGSPRHNLIADGCPSSDDDTVGVEHNGQGTSVQFCFSMFEFYGINPDIYLHCKVVLCPVGDQSCLPDCTGSLRRKRRSAGSEYADGNPALITMAWKK